MAFYVSYIIFKEPNRALGHASIAVTEYDQKTPSNPPKILFRVGLMRPGQVQLEDFIIAKKDRKFFHKTYSISQNQLAILLRAINSDRNKLSNKSTKKFRVEDTGTKSIPGGPAHNFITHNCKTYTLSLLEKIGIIDPSLKNLGIDIPIFSGNLFSLEFKPSTDKFLEWACPFIVSNYEINNRTDKIENFSMTKNSVGSQKFSDGLDKLKQKKDLSNPAEFDPKNSEIKKQNSLNLFEVEFAEEKIKLESKIILFNFYAEILNNLAKLYKQIELEIVKKIESVKENIIKDLNINGNIGEKIKSELKSKGYPAAKIDNAMQEVFLELIEISKKISNDLTLDKIKKEINENKKRLALAEGKLSFYISRLAENKQNNEKDSINTIKSTAVEIRKPNIAYSKNILFLQNVKNNLSPEIKRLLKKYESKEKAETIFSAKNYKKNNSWVLNTYANSRINLIFKLFLEIENSKKELTTDAVLQVLKKLANDLDENAKTNKEGQSCFYRFFRQVNLFCRVRHDQTDARVADTMEAIARLKI